VSEIGRAPLRVVERCRACGSSSLTAVLSLGETPLANSLLEPDDPGPAITYPLNLVRCPECALLQIAEVVSPPALFSDYVYFSSFSETMLRHAEALAGKLVEEERLGDGSLVVEVASNDGYLLRFFKQRGVPVLGVEPAANIARVAEAEHAIPTVVEFFGVALAERLVAEGRRADVVIGNNVLAHVPELNDFAAGVRLLLSDRGRAVFEFPYVKNMLDGLEFDTIYHEHQCYFSLAALSRLFACHDLDVCDVERIPIHGGSLRLSVAPAGSRRPSPRVAELRQAEEQWGVSDAAPYDRFAASVGELRERLVAEVRSLKAGGARLAAYGAAAKGVTLLSYCGLGAAELEFVADRSSYKQGKRYPVGALPILPPSALEERRPDYALLLTWNFADEILRQQEGYRAAGGRFIVPVPEPRIA
jgi:hypothetical protein